MCNAKDQLRQSPALRVERAIAETPRKARRHAMQVAQLLLVERKTKLAHLYCFPLRQ